VTSLTELGWISCILAIVIITPFILFFLFAIGSMSADRIFAAHPTGRPDYTGMLSALVWQYGGWDSVASVSSEVVNPRRTFPVGFAVVLCLETFCYLSVTIAGVSIEPRVSEWETASFSNVASRLPYCKEGWLSFWIAVAGTGSALSLLNSGIAFTGRELYASARLDAFPCSFFPRTLWRDYSDQDAPIPAMIIMSVLTIPFAMLDSVVLIEFTALFRVLAILVHLAIFVASRIPAVLERLKAASQAPGEVFKMTANSLGLLAKLDQSRRGGAFVIGGGWFGVVLCVLPVFAVCVGLIVISSWESLVVAVGAVAGLFLLKFLEMLWNRVSAKRAGKKGRGGDGDGYSS
jgi:amino acid transporter